MEAVRKRDTAFEAYHWGKNISINPIKEAKEEHIIPYYLPGKRTKAWMKCKNFEARNFTV